MYFKILCGNAGSTSQEISQQKRALVLMGLTLDGNRKHTAKFATKWCKDNNFNVLNWSSQSPDFRLTENVWVEVKYV